jgi:hemoglobin
MASPAARAVPVDLLREPRPIHPAIEEALIAEVVPRFYARVRRDPLLGPIFERALEGRWDAHLLKLCDFWSSVTMMTGRYKGTPLHAHRALEPLTEAHFARWLALWRETVTQVCPPEVADILAERAERIARSLQLGLTRFVPATASPSPAPKS